MEKLNSFQLNRQIDQLYSIFKESKNNNLDSYEFIKTFINSDEFKNKMLSYYSCPYWDNGASYVLEDFLDKYKIVKGNTLTDMDLRCLARYIIYFIYKYNISVSSINNNLSNIVSKIDTVDYYTPEELIKEYQMT